MQFCNHFYSHLIINVLSSWWPLNHSSWRIETNQSMTKQIDFFFANSLSLSFQKWWARFPLCKILAAMVLFFWCCNIWIHWKTACYGMFLLMKWTSIFHQKYYLPIKGMVPIQCLSDLMTLMFHIGFVILRHLNKHKLAS